MARERIIIVGGGFTGLAAAYDLARSGADLDIILLENAPRLGGLAAGFPLLGTYLEKAYHYLFLTDTDIIGLIRELGLEKRLMWSNSTIGIYVGGHIYPFTSPMDLLRFTPCSIFGRLRLGLSALYLQKKKNWCRFIRISALDWMRRICGRSALRAVWSPLLKGKFSRYHDQVSMAWLWARIHTRANSRDAGREQLGYIRGGFSSLVQALEQELRSAGVQVRCNSNVTRMEIGDGDRALEVNGERMPFDQCLFTGPSYVFAKLLPNDPELAAYAAQLQSVEYLGAVCLIFVSEQRLAEQSWLNIHEEDAPFVVFVQHSRLTSETLYAGKEVYYCGCYAPQDSPIFKESEESLGARWLSYVGKIFPHFDLGRVSEWHVFRFKAAQHIVDTNYEEKIPAHQTPLAGVYLANFSQIFPEDRGTNFAVRAGRQVAALILKHLMDNRRAKLE
jgi:protoporphyrinogen oxidase